MIGCVHRKGRRRFRSFFFVFASRYLQFRRFTELQAFRSAGFIGYLRRNLRPAAVLPRCALREVERRRCQWPPRIGQNPVKLGKKKRKEKKRKPRGLQSSMRATIWNNSVALSSNRPTCWRNPLAADTTRRRPCLPTTGASCLPSFTEFVAPLSVVCCLPCCLLLDRVVPSCNPVSPGF